MSRLLLVDDDRELAELLGDELTRAGHQVLVADSLFAALRAAASEPPFDALITDLNLPDADGAAVAEALGIPIKLALTGSSAAADVQRLEHAGFAAVLVKPFTAATLIDALRRALGGSPG